METIYTLAEFCTAYKIRPKYLSSAIHRGQGPDVVCINGRLHITFSAAKKWAKTAEKINPYRVRYNTSERDQEVFNKACEAYKNYAEIVGYTKARSKLARLFGVKKISQLDVDRQLAAANFFNARAAEAVK